MIYPPALADQILSAIDSVMFANNGYADIGNSADIAQALRTAGFVVLACKNLHGAPCFKAFTPAAQKALASEPFGVSTYKPVIAQASSPDYEGMILDRQERESMYD